MVAITSTVNTVIPVVISNPGVGIPGITDSSDDVIVENFSDVSVAVVDSSKVFVGTEVCLDVVVPVVSSVVTVGE